MRIEHVALYVNDLENTKTDNYSSKNCVLSALRLAL